ncbi:MAG TPA: extracellular solute-binding protein [Trueperaceae bacterium]
MRSTHWFRPVLAGPALLLVVLLAGQVLAQEVVLDFPSWQATEPGTSDWFKALIDEFESEHPGVHIEFTNVPYSNYNQTLLTRFAGGNPPDIVHLPAANLQIYASQGWLEPLGDRMAQTDIPEFWNPLQDVCVYQGEPVCVLVLGYGYVMGYNQQAFDEAGVESVPENSDELFAAAKKLTVDKNGDGVIDQYGFAFPTVNDDGIVTVATNLIFEFDEDAHWVDAQGQLNREAITYAWKKMRDMVDAGVVPLGLNDNAKRQFFMEGRAAMVLEGPWIQGFIDEAAPNVRPHLAVAQVPFAGPAYGGPSNVLAIPKAISPEKKELVWDFIKLFSSEEWQRKYAEIAGQPPARSEVLTEAYLQQHPQMATFVQAAQNAKSYFPPGMRDNYTEFRDLAITATLDAVVQGQPIDDVLNDLQRQVDRLR